VAWPRNKKEVQQELGKTGRAQYMVGQSRQAKTLISSPVISVFAKTHISIGNHNEKYPTTNKKGPDHSDLTPENL
jgi:hypothetical protein